LDRHFQPLNQLPGTAVEERRDLMLHAYGSPVEDTRIAHCPMGRRFLAYGNLPTFQPDNSTGEKLETVEEMRRQVFDIHLQQLSDIHLQ
jgi:hypothetical protein